MLLQGRPALSWQREGRAQVPSLAVQGLLLHLALPTNVWARMLRETINFKNMWGHWVLKLKRNFGDHEIQSP